MLKTRPISWVKAAQKDFDRFPQGAQVDLARALTIVAEGGHPDIAKPMQGLGSGILELALRFNTDAYRVVYAVQIGDAVWILHAFQKKSRSGAKTPKSEINLIEERLKRLKETLK